MFLVQVQICTESQVALAEVQRNNRHDPEISTDKRLHHRFRPSERGMSKKCYFYLVRFLHRLLVGLKQEFLLGSRLQHEDISTAKFTAAESFKPQQELSQTEFGQLTFLDHNRNLWPSQSLLMNLMLQEYTAFLREHLVYLQSVKTQPIIFIVKVAFVCCKSECKTALDLLIVFHFSDADPDQVAIISTIKYC